MLVVIYAPQSMCARNDISQMQPNNPAGSQVLRGARTHAIWLMRAPLTTWECAAYMHIYIYGMHATHPPNHQILMTARI